jgi:hypothetical protein
MIFDGRDDHHGHSGLPRLWRETYTRRCLGCGLSGLTLLVEALQYCDYSCRRG